GEIVMVNSQSELLFNRERENLISRNIRTLVPGWEFHLRPGWDDDVGVTKIRSTELGIELQALRDGGEPFPVEITFSPLQTEEGVVITSAIRDISDRKRADEQIHELNAKLEERVLQRTEALLRSNDELQQFAYGASPDLQEPLRTV